MKHALITGIAGQDGYYLTQLLLSKGYAVHGLVRQTSSSHSGLRARFQNVISEDSLSFHHADLADSSSLRNVFDQVQPDEVYHLAGQSNVGFSFEVPEYNAEINGVAAVRLLECVRRCSQNPRFFQSCTSEMFGNSGNLPHCEQTPFAPVSPYAAAKVYAYNMGQIYRAAHGLFVCSGILFNHESPLRGENFVTKKIVRYAVRIAAGLDDSLKLGQTDVRRDWGFAGDYVEAMWLMMQAPKPDDYVVASGESHSVRDFCELAFSEVGLDYRKHVVVDPHLFRPADIADSCGNSEKIRQRLGWRPRVSFEGLVKMMVDAERRELKGKGRL
jgi:GDPmannose 4,6-dehydratase